MTVHRTIASQAKRVIKFVTVSGMTFALDLLLLYVLIDVFLWNYILATGVAFAASVSLSYFPDRRWVFAGTLRSVHAGYVVFMEIACVGIVIAMAGMSVLVGRFHLHYLDARIIIAGMVGLWNYLMNLYVNFKVAGRFLTSDGRGCDAGVDADRTIADLIVDLPASNGRDVVS